MARDKASKVTRVDVAGRTQSGRALDVAITAPVTAALNAHAARTDNPHVVTKAQVGLSAVPNLDTTVAVAHPARTDNPHAVTAAQVGAPTTATFNAHVADVGNPHAVTAAQVGSPTTATFNTHVADTANPHAVTKAQVGLTNVPNLDTTATINKVAAGAGVTGTFTTVDGKTITVTDGVVTAIV